jgi:two-component system NtrC family sensor kinase
MMRISFPISIKLLMIVLPLVFVPISIVGYLSYKASVESVTQLSRNQQMLQANAAAKKINTIFESCCADLETMAALLLDDLHSKHHPPAAGKLEDHRDKILKLFRHFRSRSPYYLEIHLLDAFGRGVLGPRSSSPDETAPTTVPSYRSVLYSQESSCQVSKIKYSEAYQKYVLQFSKSVLYDDNAPPGQLVIDLDFDSIIEMVNTIRIGKHGFAFMVDQSGRTIAHPQYRPYEYDLTKYNDPRLRELVVDMLSGDSGWRTFFHFGEKAAAFAPISATGYSLAVSIPIDEFKREARSLRATVLQMVIVMLLLAGLAVGIMSYLLLKPIRQLVLATDQIAGGDLRQEIPVKTGDELGTLTRSFNRMVRNLREIQTELIRSEKLISMGKVSAGVAHEIRNPLNAVKGAIVYLQMHLPDDPVIREYTHLMLTEINRLDKFVVDFLYFAKQSSPNLLPANLNELIQNTSNLLNEEFRTKAIHVKTHLDPTLPPVMIDPYQMEQVFLNVFVNAMDAMPNGGNLEVSTALKHRSQGTNQGSESIVTIRDEGVGISKKDLNSIFDPFFSTKETGTGLGLPISLGIVENHGGTIHVTSEEHMGTTVTIELPLEAHAWQGGPR